MAHCSNAEVRMRPKWNLHLRLPPELTCKELWIEPPNYICSWPLVSIFSRILNFLGSRTLNWGQRTSYVMRGLIMKLSKLQPQIWAVLFSCPPLWIWTMWWDAFTIRGANGMWWPLLGTRKWVFKWSYLAVALCVCKHPVWHAVWRKNQWFLFFLCSLPHSYSLPVCAQPKWIPNGLLR